MLNILIILFLIFYFILAKIRLDWAIMFLIAVLPSYLIRFSIFNIPFTLLEAMILISFMVWLFANYRKIYFNLNQKIKLLKNPKSGRYPFDIEIILMLIISFVAVAIVGFSNNALGIWKAYFFEPIFIFILIFNVFKNNEKSVNDTQKARVKFNIEKVLWAITISALFVSAFAIYQKFTGHFIFNELWASEKTRRVVSFFGYPNAVGLYLSPLILLMFGWFVKQIISYKFQINSKFQILKIIFTTIIIILSLISIYFAKCEGALIGILAGIVVFGLFIGKKIRYAMLLLIFIFGVSTIIYQPAWYYATKRITLQDLSGEIRKQQWRETWQMVTVSSTKFIFGSGLANYQNAIKPYHQEGIFFNKENDPDFRRKIVIFDNQYKAKYWQPVEIYLYPHNIFLNFWTELGLVGMLLFIFVIGKYFIICLKIIKKYNLKIQTLDYYNEKYFVVGLMCSMIVIVVHGLVDVPYFKNDLAIMFWMLIAMISFYDLECANNLQISNQKK